MRFNRLKAITLTLLLFSGGALRAWGGADSKSVPERQANTKAYELADHVFYREAKFIGDLKPYSPIVETYIQNFKGNQELGQVPSSDKYFIGRMLMKNGVEDVSFQKNSKSPGGMILEKLDGFYKMNYVALGFMQMIYIPGFDKNNYEL